jgi:hypothetical protein
LNFWWECFSHYELWPVVWRDRELTEYREKHAGDGTWCDAVDAGLEGFAVGLGGG